MPNITPAHGLAFIRRIATEECYRGGAILIPEQVRDKIVSDQWEVVSVGAPEPCDDEDCERIHDEGQQSLYVPGGPDRSHPVYLIEGDWVLAKKRAPMATPDPDIFVVRVDDVIGRFVERSR